MIATIGSLVQATEKSKWARASLVHVAASAASAAALGALLATTGAVLGRMAGLWAPEVAGRPSLVGGAIGGLAIAYGLSDLGILPLPRPVLMPAVPVTWWRRWKPYGASAAYGAALGLGFTTRIPFGGYYVLCLLCLVSSDPTSSAVWLGTYGLARSVAVVLASPAAHHGAGGIHSWASRSGGVRQVAHFVSAGACISLGTGVLLSWLMSALT